MWTVFVCIKVIKSNTNFKNDLIRYKRKLGYEFQESDIPIDRNRYVDFLIMYSSEPIDYKLPCEYRLFNKNNLMQDTITKTYHFISKKITKFVSILYLISFVPISKTIPELSVFYHHFDKIIRIFNNINEGIDSWLVIIEETLH